MYSHILSEKNENNKWNITEKDEKVTNRQHATNWFFPLLRLLFFSVIPTFEENLYNDM